MELQIKQLDRQMYRELFSKSVNQFMEGKPAVLTDDMITDILYQTFDVAFDAGLTCLRTWIDESIDDESVIMFIKTDTGYARMAG